MDYTAPVAKITRSGATGPRFSPHDIPGFVKSRDWVSSFTVDREGRVYFLVHECGGQTGPCGNDVVRFGTDGKYQATTTLAGSDFGPEEIAVFSGGRFFVSGMGQGMGSGNPYTPHAAVFGNDGKLISTVQLPGDVKAPPFVYGTTPTPEQNTGTAYLAAGTDGNVYFVRPIGHATLYVIGPNGAVLHHSAVRPPYANGVPMEMRYAGNGAVMVEFGKREGQGVSSTGYLFAQIDAASGRTLAYYTADANTGGLPACMLPDSGFEFISTGDGGPTAIRFDPIK